MRICAKCRDGHRAELEPGANGCLYGRKSCPCKKCDTAMFIVAVRVVTLHMHRVLSDPKTKQKLDEFIKAVKEANE